MSKSISSLQSSKAQVLAAKEAFSREFAVGRGDRSVGVGLNRRRDDWAVKVYAASETAAGGLPGQFHGYDVDVVVTGEVAAHV